MTPKGGGEVSVPSPHTPDALDHDMTGGPGAHTAGLVVPGAL